MKRASKILFVIVMTAALLLSGCGASKSADYATSTYYNSVDAANYKESYDTDTYAEALEFSDYGTSQNAEGMSQSQVDSTTDSAASPDRKLIKNAYLTIETLEFDKSCAMIENCTASLGGYIESSDVNNNNFYYYDYNTAEARLRHATYTIRIPNSRLNEFLNRTSEMGTLNSKSVTSRDVTLDYVDVESRAKSLEIQLDRLLALLAEADNMEDILILEERISEVTYQLEERESVLKNYDNLVTFSTINITLNEVTHVTVVEPIPETVGERISSGLSETFYNLGEGFKNFAVWFVVNLPYILVWGTIIGLNVFIIVLICRKRTKRNIARAAAYQAQTLARASAQAQLQAQAQAQPQPQQPANPAAPEQK